LAEQAARWPLPLQDAPLAAAASGSDGIQTEQGLQGMLYISAASGSSGIQTEQGLLQPPLPASGSSGIGGDGDRKTLHQVATQLQEELDAVLGNLQKLHVSPAGSHHSPSASEVDKLVRSAANSAEQIQALAPACAMDDEQAKPTVESNAFMDEDQTSYENKSGPAKESTARVDRAVDWSKTYGSGQAYEEDGKVYHDRQPDLWESGSNYWRNSYKWRKPNQGWSNTYATATADLRHTCNHDGKGPEPEEIGASGASGSGGSSGSKDYVRWSDEECRLFKEMRKNNEGKWIKWSALAREFQAEPYENGLPVVEKEKELHEHSNLCDHDFLLPVPEI
jgi:hypothetical protein